jgi:hypothetical protein
LPAVAQWLDDALEEQEGLVQEQLEQKQARRTETQDHDC